MSLSESFEIDWSDLLGLAIPGPVVEVAACASAVGLVSIDGETVAGEDCAKAGEAKSAANIVIAVK